jgi:hypothetical protein
MPNDELNLNATLNRTANALEHIACSLLAIEMLRPRRLEARMRRACMPIDPFSTTDAQPAEARHRTRQN